MESGYFPARALLLFTLIFFSSVVTAASSQVTDIVRLRAGGGDGFRTIQTLPANTPVTVLEEGPDYTQVKTADGKTGWVNTRFLKSVSQESNAVESVNSSPIGCDALQQEAHALRDQIARLQLAQDQAASTTVTERLSFSVAGILLGVLAGMAGLRAYYLKRLRGLRI